MKLKRAIKQSHVISCSVGMAIATSSYTAGIEISKFFAGDLAWISIMIAGIMCLFSSICFAELTRMYPSAAGIKLFIHKAFNENIAIIISLFYAIIAITMVGSESYILSKVLTSQLIVITKPVDEILWMLLFFLIIAYINYRGIEITGKIQNILVFIMILSLLGFSIYSLFYKNFNLNMAFDHPTFNLNNVIQAASLGVFLYVGFEWVTPLAEEVTDYKMIPRGMLFAIGILSVTYSIFIVSMKMNLTSEQLASRAPFPQILFAQNVIGPYGVFVFLILSVIASLTSYNTGLLSTSRLFYALSREHILPKSFSKIHLNYTSPWVSILGITFFSILVALIIQISNQYLFPIIMVAALECIIYVIMAICVIKLKKKFPERERPYQSPFGYFIPVVTVIIFTILLLGIFTGTTKDRFDIIIFKNYWIAISMIFVLILISIYTYTVVPKLKKQYSIKNVNRIKRRPVRTIQGD